MRRHVVALLCWLALVACRDPIAPPSVMDEGAMIFVTEVDALDLVTGEETTLYFSSDDITTGAADTPAHTAFVNRILRPITIRRDIYSPGTTQGPSKVSVGELVLDNSDGALDYLVRYAFDGRRIVQRMAEAKVAYPAAYTPMLIATMGLPEFTSEEVRLTVRDRQALLDAPLQPALYSGDGLVDGLEGDASLKGKPKPLLFGRALNMSPPLVNASKLIYQVHAGRLASVDGVYDDGVQLAGPATIAWTEIASPITDLDAVGRAAAYSPELMLFVALVDPVGTKSAIRSEDGGITWVGCDVPWSATPGHLYGLVWGADLFVAVGDYDSGDPAVFTSPDGIVWTERPQVASILGAITLYGAFYAESLKLFVAVGETGTIITSADYGSTWTAQASGVTEHLRAGVWNNNTTRAVVVGDNNTVLSSVNLTAWTPRTSGFAATMELTGVATDGRRTRFVIVGAFGCRAYSDDAVTWVDVSTGGGSPPNLTAVTFYEGFGFAVPAQLTGTSARFYQSGDGATWTTNGYISSPFYQEALAIGAGAIVVVGSVRAIPGSAKLYRAPLPLGLYTSVVDMMDETLAPGWGWAKAYLNGGYVRLGSTPFGILTADASEGATVADRTGAQLWTRALLACGLTSADWSAADVTALDVANSAEQGMWTGMEAATCADLANAAAGSIGAWWGVDRLGIFRTAQFKDPATETPSAYLIENMMVTDPERVATADPGRGLPIWRSVLRYARNYTVQTAFGAAVTDAVRALRSREWNEVASTDTTVREAHPLAGEMADDTLLLDGTAAATEVARRRVLRSMYRDRFEFKLPLTVAHVAMDLGAYANVSHSRFLLTAGQNFIIVTLEMDGAAEKLLVGVWGGEPGALCYPAEAGGRWYLSQTAADQDAVLAIKDSRLFLDLGVTTGGLLRLYRNRLDPITLPASTT